MSLGIDPTRPSIVFVGRITRQKGLPYLLRAAERLPADVQLVLCAGAPDTPEIMAEVTGLVELLQASAHRRGLDRPDAAARRARAMLLSSRPPRSCARRSTSRSASSTSRPWPARWRSSGPRPAASPRSSTTASPAAWCRSTRWTTAPAPLATRSSSSPTWPTTLTAVTADPQRARRMGVAGRRRAEDHFSWDAIADRTMDVYRSVTG